jgi:hypothetical protein
LSFANNTKAIIPHAKPGIAYNQQVTIDMIPNTKVALAFGNVFSPVNIDLVSLLSKISSIMLKMILFENKKSPEKI